MIPWFFTNPARLKLERSNVDLLSKNASWFVGHKWGLDHQLYLDAVIRCHDKDYDIRVTFPSLYPDTPPIVRPLNLEHRVTTHQYGNADGPLCLEWGPDNWHHDVTAVQMLESTYRLLTAETFPEISQPDIPKVVPSRHELTLGQEMRGSVIRWYQSDAVTSHLIGQAEEAIGIFKLSFHTRTETFTTLIHEIHSPDGESWVDHTVPSPAVVGGEPKELVSGTWAKSTIDKASIQSAINLDDLIKLIDQHSSTSFSEHYSNSSKDNPKSLQFFLVVDASGELHLLLSLSNGKLVICTPVSSDSAPIESRSPDVAILSPKTVGIVGLGSAGSKLAITLARMGVRKFYLVDHDILLPENLQRHALDWQSVMMHKVDALRLAILKISPEASIEGSSLHLTGQESTASIDGCIQKLRSCDLLVDATSDSTVFNLLSSIAVSAKVPLVWLQILEGGIGGVVARSRPNIDPTPLDMRNAYLQFCNDNPFPHLGEVRIKYATISKDEVMAASDADVTIIAHHAARFIPDILRGGQSSFPYSFYLIGLLNKWVFDAPFSTIPLSVTNFPTTGWSSSEEQDLNEDDINFLTHLLEGT